MAMIRVQVLMTGVIYMQLIVVPKILLFRLEGLGLYLGY